ncbi:DJ-1/PfpI family protein [Sphingobacterium griseoflavum]|uniref:Glutamine amidotransferase n=1 Tax=Sphingobacterium griseoflavum TaxID=1474952 RepID=A0ABQ3HUN9_9SPHI|nr:DJ-1/PfpI family protein [Sphingobacterium griseoflavum]GHE35378.1 glutamine amidotransferase [Sphingobacterium griseoflavum]
MKNTIAILISDGFDEWAVKGSQQFFKSHKESKLVLISPKQGEFVRSWNYKDWGASYAIDEHLQEADPAMFDALIMPGGALSIDNLRTNVAVLDFVQHFIDHSKPIGTLCHGIWPLLELDCIRNKKLTSVASIKTDIIRAHGQWIDQAVVQDGFLISSRTSDDLDAFLSHFNEVLASILQE